MSHLPAAEPPPNARLPKIPRTEAVGANRLKYIGCQIKQDYFLKHAQITITRLVFALYRATKTQKRPALSCTAPSLSRSHCTIR